jgi:hypothetical protein
VVRQDQCRSAPGKFLTTTGAKALERTLPFQRRTDTNLHCPGVNLTGIALFHFFALWAALHRPFRFAIPGFSLRSEEQQLDNTQDRVQQSYSKQRIYSAVHRRLSGSTAISPLPCASFLKGKRLKTKEI